MSHVRGIVWSVTATVGKRPDQSTGVHIKMCLSAISNQTSWLREKMKFVRKGDVYRKTSFVGRRNTCNHLIMFVSYTIEQPLASALRAVCI